MSNMEAKFGKKVFMRDVGNDESWLQDILYKDPSILGLGDYLTPGKREEKKGLADGRFHILLESVVYAIRYEVEVMLGETDALQIINCLELWDNAERSRHAMHNVAVLVAESFEGKYFNLLQTLSLNLPIIAIQANLLEVDNEYVLSFSKIFEMYLGPEVSEETTGDESVWSEECPWTLNTAKGLYNLIDADHKYMEYKENSINIYIHERKAYHIEKSSEPNSVVSFTVFDDEKVKAIDEIFYNNNFATYNLNRNKEFVMNVDVDMINRKKEIFIEIMKIRYKSLLSHRLFLMKP